MMEQCCCLPYFRAGNVMKMLLTGDRSAAGFVTGFPQFMPCVSFSQKTQVDEKDVYLSSMIIIRPQVQIEFTPTAVFSRIGGGRQQRKAFERLNSVASRTRISTSLRR